MCLEDKLIATTETDTFLDKVLSIMIKYKQNQEGVVRPRVKKASEAGKKGGI